MPLHPSHVKKLGDAIRRLMEAKEVTGIQLTADIGLTATPASRILKGASCSRQVTFSHLMKRLCETREEEPSILRAYSPILEGVPGESILEDEENRREEIARCERFLEIKTQSISFKNSVARKQAKAGTEAKQDYCEGLVSTDFLIERDGKRVAPECKFNVHRDLGWKARTQAELALMTDLFPLLTKRADGRDISGLSAYEQ
jgi:hypothetical protein